MKGEDLTITSNQLIKVLNKTINSIDGRFIEHGNRVAYIMFNLLRISGKYTDEEIFKICVISIFHDIGAYKVAERDKLLNADMESPLNHAVYGALFIKKFSPLSKHYNVVLSHHFTMDYYKKLNVEILSYEGLMLSFADYVDRLSLNNIKIDYNKIEKYYLKEHFDLFKKADEKYKFLNKLSDGTYVNELEVFFEKRVITEEKVISYSKMIAYAIDFRSESTVIHTITVEAISEQLARLCGFSEEKISLIKICALLHDIGKISIPVEILEKPGKLTDEEFEIMKNHSKIGYNILSELNMNEIRDIATLHHEKLDGSGYPFGLKDEKITKEMRIVSIGDIVSALIGSRSYKQGFSKTKIVSILTEMVENNKIDKDIVDLFIHNYEYIIDEAMKQCRDTMDKYLNIKNEYRELMKIYT
ncbi:MAG: HD domain-containing protein [Clostridium butyricum]|nr:HD domain-containing phosphohydrolase [Clostridium butyricum]MDU1507033.1 HD domain-containing protein [Clostridium butyricum]MDU4803030.1 HD domain-containing protein [Clostridium butyricum]